jgi:predicted tellurium resistance membrane protein TerC
MWIGLLSGMTIGSRFVRKDMGFAAGPMVLMYGLVGAIAALLIAVVLSRQLTAKELRLAALCALILSAIGAGLLAMRIAEVSRGSEVHSRARAAVAAAGTSRRSPAPDHRCTA